MTAAAVSLLKDISTKLWKTLRLWHGYQYWIFYLRRCSSLNRECAAFENKSEAPKKDKVLFTFKPQNSCEMAVISKQSQETSKTNWKKNKMFDRKLIFRQTMLLRNHAEVSRLLDGGKDSAMSCMNYAAVSNTKSLDCSPPSPVIMIESACTAFGAFFWNTGWIRGCTTKKNLIPKTCTNEIYERLMAEEMEQLKRKVFFWLPLATFFCKTSRITGAESCKSRMKGYSVWKRNSRELVECLSIFGSNPLSQPAIHVLSEKNSVDEYQ